MTSENDEIVSAVSIACKDLLSDTPREYFACGTHLRITDSKATEGMTFPGELISHNPVRRPSFPDSNSLARTHGNKNFPSPISM
ncbi:hypothetical protein V1477_001501 [Vespula maculifrons]|uniref:Uncharacterized protein n=1 Tax=Vespula maculifrons TaxID=7453 RepID=A0ABD2D1J8_VESMC